MNKNVTIFRNTANLIVLIRILLVFLIIGLFNSDHLIYNIFGLIFLILIAVLDWLDGYLARVLNISSRIGGLLDTLGDRVTENLLLFFLAYKRLVPLWIPLIFVTRSFIADFIRYLSFTKGIDTFSINKSKLGFYIVASRTSRVAYLLYKILIFLAGGIVITLESFISQRGHVVPSFVVLKHLLLYGSVFLLIFNLIRFAFLVYDSRFVLKEQIAK